MIDLWRNSIRVLQDLAALTRTLRAPLLLGVLSFVILSSPAQIHELYLILARDWWRLWFQTFLALVSLGGLSFFLTYVSRALIRVDKNSNAGCVKDRRHGALARATPIIIGVLPLLGVALGAYSALQGTITETLRSAIATFDAVKSPSAIVEAVRKIEAVPDAAARIDKHFAFGSLEKPTPDLLAQLPTLLRDNLPSAILELPQSTQALQVAIYSAIAICVLLAIAIITTFSINMYPIADTSLSSKGVFHPLVTLAFCISFLALTTVFAAQDPDIRQTYGYDLTAVPRAVGTVFIVNLWLMFLVFFCSFLTLLADKHRIPLLAPLIALAVAASYFNLNDNHTIRQVTVPASDLAGRRIAGGKDQVPPAVLDAFNAWLASRPPEYMKRFIGKPYPVYVVAAQGGGMYAANLSGLFLARLYDRCPLIRHHLFAISGVSGGSVGAGFLAALLNESPETLASEACEVHVRSDRRVMEKGPLETKMEALLQVDFLAPVSASFLFPDLLQRFIPLPIDALDRARAFEAGLESAWDLVVKSGTNPLRQGSWKHWRSDGPAPMLLLNVTDVDSGRQIAIAPAELGPTRISTIGSDVQSLHSALRLGPEVDMPLSTAMSLSARFPLIMPAGLLNLGTRASDW